MLSHELRNPLGAALNATYVLDCVAADRAARIARPKSGRRDPAASPANGPPARRSARRGPRHAGQDRNAPANASTSPNSSTTLSKQSGRCRCQRPSARRRRGERSDLHRGGLRPDPANPGKSAHQRGQVHTPQRHDRALARQRGRRGRAPRRRQRHRHPPEMLESIFDMFVQSDNTLSRSTAAWASA